MVREVLGEPLEAHPGSENGVGPATGPEEHQGVHLSDAEGHTEVGYPPEVPPGSPSTPPAEPTMAITPRKQRKAEITAEQKEYEERTETVWARMWWWCPRRLDREHD